MRKSAILLALGLAVFTNGLMAEAGLVESCQFLPIVIDVEASGTRYQTELSFTNANRDAQDVAVRYTAAFGSVEGNADGRFSVPAGEQILVPDGIEFLRRLGIGIPQATPISPQGGTLRVCSPFPAEIPVGVMARVTSPTRPPFPAGKSAVSFAAVPAEVGFTGRATVFGLRRSPLDRSNVAIYNPGTELVSVRITVVSGSSGKAIVLSEKEDLTGYGWKQFTNLTFDDRFSQGFVVIERVSAGGVFGAYGVINDNDTNDGSFVPATSEGEDRTSWILPVLVDTPSYRSELILANPSDVDVKFSLEYTESVSSSRDALSATVSVAAHRQVIVPDVFELFKDGIWSGGTRTLAGTLRVRALAEQIRGAFVGVRVITRQESGRFGVFTPPVSPESVGAKQGFLWSLRADAETRSNVAVLNAGTASGENVTLQLQAFDGAKGRPAGAPLTVTLESGQWLQPEGFFASAGVSNGYVRIVRVSGDAPWSAYGVVNDGQALGKGTGDGSFIPVLFSGVPVPLPEGAWGATGVRMLVDSAGIHIEGDCSHGSLLGTVFLDPQGRFNGVGTYTFEGGPVPIGGFPSQIVFYRGVVEKNQMTLNIQFILSPSPGSMELRFEVIQGVSPRLFKCP